MQYFSEIWLKALSLGLGIPLLLAIIVLVVTIVVKCSRLVGNV